MRRSTLPAPLTIIGYRKDGRPIRVIAGGSEDGGQGGAGGNAGAAGGSADQGGQGGAQTGAQGGNQNGNQNGTQQAGPFDHITDVAELRAVAARLQAEAGQAGGKSREQARQAAAEDARKGIVADISKALGLTSEAKDPAELERQIAKLTADQTERDRELAIYRAALAPGMNVDAGRLLDSRSFMRSMSDVDPNGDGALSAITDRIKKAVSSDPSLQLRQVSGGGSVGHAGGAGDHRNPDLSKLHGDQLMEAAYAANAAQK